MGFWEFGLQEDHRIAIIDDCWEKEITYGQLKEDAKRLSNYLTKQYENKNLGFVYCKNTYACIVGYISSLQAEHAVCLVDVKINKLLNKDLISTYSPEWIWYPGDFDEVDYYFTGYELLEYKLYERKVIASGIEINENLGLLLSTSGTTGSSKMVRLSYENLQSNAKAIAKYLNLTPNERPITTLPIQYSYGLSVINSHLSVGATILLTNQTVVNKKFWDTFTKYHATSMSGVPFTYNVLKKTGIEKRNLPSLKSLTQAGGRLSMDMQSYFANYAKERDIDFFIMYGQTEATARISYVPPFEIEKGMGSVGIAIPGGRFEIDSKTHEVIYYGSNVMLGYAFERSDLSRPDEMNGRLATGDIGELDNNGFLHIMGRIKRFIKPFGLKVNLDDIEKKLELRLGISCYCVGDDERLIIVVNCEEERQRVLSVIGDIYIMHSSRIKVVVAGIPLSDIGKVDYRKLYEQTMTLI